MFGVRVRSFLVGVGRHAGARGWFYDDAAMTYEELAEQIRAFPGTLAVARGDDRVDDDATTGLAQVALAAKIARATQESLSVRVKIARGRGATWTMVGNTIGITPTRAEQRYLERRPFGARW